MDTPIVDFVKNYQKKKMSRFHMPGHKGHVFFGCEPYDITEIKGADVLHMGNGIIAESEKNASLLFGSGATFFSTEGSSHCIKSMLAVLIMASGQKEKSFPVFWPSCGGAGGGGVEKVVKRPFLLAARNVHRSMIDGCALLDLDVVFIREREKRSLCTSLLEAEDVKAALEELIEPPLAVYLTSPDYLGQAADIEGIAKVCEDFDVPLVVDNAHGAYLHFYERKHPLDFGAAMCCDSAHKTLPVLTGGAYLHVHKRYRERFGQYADQAMMVFGTTSPSYLVLQSLDLCNRYLAEDYEEKLEECIRRVEKVKGLLQKKGIPVKESEPLKIVIGTAECGYTGEETGEELRKNGIECEYADREQVVLMVTPENEEQDFLRLLSWGEKSFLRIKKKQIISGSFTMKQVPERVMSIRDAAFAKSEMIPVTEALGRICAAETISCPPAVPIAVCGERISEEMIRVFLEYGIAKVSVISGL